jgi:hypothetical protein
MKSREVHFFGSKEVLTQGSEFHHAFKKILRESVVNQKIRGKK